MAGALDDFDAAETIAPAPVPSRAGVLPATPVNAAAAIASTRVPAPASMPTAGMTAAVAKVAVTATAASSISSGNRTGDNSSPNPISNSAEMTELRQFFATLADDPIGKQLLSSLDANPNGVVTCRRVAESRLNTRLEASVWAKLSLFSSVLAARSRF